MTACTVFCYQCPTVDGRTKQFRSLCVDCSEETLSRHRAETKHTDLELRVVDDFTDTTAANIRRRQAFWAAQRTGWGT